VVSKKATIRNRVKRQVRHQLKDLLETLQNKSLGYDIIITVKTPLLTIPVDERLKILTSLLNKVGLKTKPSADTNC
jgi:ribonuclease P protein component